ncbi:MAG: glycosyltransferase [Muribaculaceae bacterium]|nr:glycosyltransferase [Muribaculaceae bacterium]
MERTVPQLSVVMPAYNTAAFLDFAIRNVVEHQFGNLPSGQWELIVIDDGSTDNCHAIAQTWQQRYPGSVTAIRTENRGVSAARNLGLEAARGRFVYFIDSDDIMLRDSLVPMCEEAERTGSDIVKFTFREIDSATYEALLPNVPQANLSAEDFFVCTASDFVRRTNGLTGPPSHHGACSTIYRREFLIANGLRFDPQYSVGEDIIMTWHTMMHNPQVLYVDRALYLYHQRPGSALHLSDASRLSALGAAYRGYLLCMLDVAKQIESTAFDAPQSRRGLAENFRYGYNRALCSIVLGGDSLANIYRTMKALKANGGDVHPGRPRFDRRDRRGISVRNKVRRWIVAYVLALFA